MKKPKISEELKNTLESIEKLCEEMTQAITKERENPDNCKDLARTEKEYSQFIKRAEQAKREISLYK